jgi:hypothetical protein
MPKIVSEMMQGKAFSRSADGGQLADTATRTWKVILSTPDESFDIASAVGVNVGDSLPGDNPIPCISLDVKGDGESRMVRIITAQYRSSPLVAGEGGTGLPDPFLLEPDVRPAKFSTSTSLMEMPAKKWKTYGSTEWKVIRNPAGDLVEGIVRLEPITTIRVTQFAPLPGTIFAQYVGHVNSETMNLGSYATYQPNTVMFRGVEATPHVEKFGDLTYRGFTNVYEFSYRLNWVFGLGACGWDSVVIVEGYNCKAFTPSLVQTNNDNFGQPLKHTSRKIATPLALADGVTVGQKVRAMVTIVDVEEGGAMQTQSAMPIALNEDGTPRLLSDSREPIVWRRQIQPDVNLTQTLQLRLS